tara:strand:- start:257 stop:733 length:477 start_codon:yes stop_codon:yes gene_type:complete
MLSGILGSLLGFGGSVVPAITDHFRQKNEQKFELKKMEKMAELRAAGFDHEIKMYEQMGADKEHQRLIEHDISINQGTGFIAGLQKSVRPVITYCFFGLFAVIEITLLMEAMEKGTEFSEAINILWDGDTKAIFAAIISFWFGSRAIDKTRNSHVNNK